MKELHDYTEDELKAEMKRRADEKEAKAKSERLAMCKLVLEHRDALVALMRHSRTSCERGGNACYHHEHGAAECNLCCLLDLYERDDIEIMVDVRLVRVRPRERT